MRIPYKRKRAGKTNYAKRLSLLVSRKPRAVIRKSLHGMSIQIIDYKADGDMVLVSAHSRDLKKFGLVHPSANISTAYLTGLLCGVRAKEKGIMSVIVDIGLQKSHPKGKLYATVKGLIDAGIEVPCDESVLPDEDRIAGNHIAAYAETAPEGVFSKYASAKVDVKALPQLIAQVKGKILG